MNEEILLRFLAAFPTIPGKKVFQKLCYFLQEAEGARLGTRFRMKHFGPYSEELDSVLDDLQERQMVALSGSRDDGYQISLTTQLEQDPNEIADEAIERLRAKFGSDLSHGLTMELQATLHFLSRESRYTGSDEDKENLIRQVRAWKGKKFDEPFMRTNIERLEKMGYLPIASG